jgi:hypothetical protein
MDAMRRVPFYSGRVHVDLPVRENGGEAIRA